MAAFNTAPVDKLVALLRGKIAFLETAPATLSWDEISAYYKQTAEGLLGYVHTAPARIKNLITTAFIACGYDIQRARPIDPNDHSLTFHTLKEIFTTICDELLALNHPTPEPTAEEIADISMAAAALWELDVNRLVPDVDFQLDMQKEKSPGDHRDVATRPLFAFVDPLHLERPTFKAFRALLDNYSADEGLRETVTAEELLENSRFLDLILDTAVMQYAHKWLHAHHKVPADREGFKAALNKAWFGLYRRKVENDSSGFEHVFLGEREGDKCVGLHNWLQLRSEESKGALNYKGKIRPKRPLPAGFPASQLITIQFDWGGIEKFISTSFVGTSPEFEMALYSLCFFNGSEETVVALGPHRVKVKAFQIKQRGQIHIGSSFPEEM